MDINKRTVELQKEMEKLFQIKEQYQEKLKDINTRLLEIQGVLKEFQKIQSEELQKTKEENKE